MCMLRLPLSYLRIHLLCQEKVIVLIFTFIRFIHVFFELVMFTLHTQVLDVFRKRVGLRSVLFLFLLVLWSAFLVRLAYRLTCA